MIQRDAGDGTYLGYDETDEPILPPPPSYYEHAGLDLPSGYAS